MNFARLLKMSPAEVSTRAQQAFAKRFGSPPPCRLILSSAVPKLPDLPPLDSLEAVEKICRHRFDLLGYTGLDFGNPIDWHFDPVHQKRAPRQPWYQIQFLDLDQVGDHKIIWELNRHQHLVTLAQAGCRDEIVAQWTDWQRENPYPIGINWASALEVAFRGLSWLWVRHLIGDFHPDLIPALHLNGWYIEHFLSTYFSPNTHLLGEGVALFAIGIMCPEISEARRWRERGWQIVLKQAETQVRPDGFHFEQSVYYHAYARDFFVFARALAALNGVPIPGSFDRTIERMNRVGWLPNFGDDDGGRVVGPRIPAYPRTEPGPVGGIYTMHSPRAQLYIRAASPPPFAAGHTHADALSIQLVIDGHPVLIDSGTFCYVCPERKRFRGTAAHNTLQVDGRDQAQPIGPFAWDHLAETVIEQWHNSGSLYCFSAHHNGYRPVIHYRYVIGLKSTFWLVRDLVIGPLSHRLDIHWHFLDDGDLVILPPAGHTWAQAIEPSDWSPVYGKKVPAKVLRFSKETELPTEFAVLLIQGEAGTFTQTGASTYEYKEPHRLHEFAFGGRFIYRASGPSGVTELKL